MVCEWLLFEHHFGGNIASVFGATEDSSLYSYCHKYSPTSKNVN